ncbi:MAG: hypothetical protein DRJ13_10165 [Bacteroidetes bacterium]|nr:MAG: hypothetical protein DRJ13_10165 [Bacteroidota bacterium]
MKMKRVKAPSVEEAAEDSQEVLKAVPAPHRKAALIRRYWITLESILPRQPRKIASIPLLAGRLKSRGWRRF